MWVLDGVSTGTCGQRLVIACRFGSPTWRQTRGDGGSRRPVLGARPVILRLAPKTAELIGETTAEWRLLEKQRDPSLDVAELAETLAEALLPVRRDRQGVPPADSVHLAPRRLRLGAVECHERSAGAVWRLGTNLRPTVT